MLEHTKNCERIEFNTGETLKNAIKNLTTKGYLTYSWMYRFLHARKITCYIDDLS
jgi:hypothetical protein